MKVKYINYYSVTSTNDIAFNEIKKINEINSPIVITSNIQTNGRGRNNKVWFNGSSNLYYSFAIKHNTNSLPMYYMQIIGGLAVYNILSELIDENVLRLKYPNDIYVLANGSKKIAGVITEHFYSYNEICTSIIGVGINNKESTFPTDLNAISLYNLNLDISNSSLTKLLSDNIIKLIKSDKDMILGIWKSKLNLTNKNISIIDNKTQSIIASDIKLESILSDCRLLVIDSNNNVRIIDNGDSIRYDLE